MHEMSYCEGVLEAVLRRASGRPVARVGVRIVLEWLQYVDTAGSATSADRPAEVVPPHTHLAAAHEGGV